VPSYEVLNAIVPAEWASLTAQEKSRIEMMLSVLTIMVNGINTRDAFLAAFGPGTTTRANLGALQKRKGSRGEQLFGSGTTIMPTDIAIALTV
jgi:hypothetical protein